MLLKDHHFNISPQFKQSVFIYWYFYTFNILQFLTALHIISLFFSVLCRLVKFREYTNWLRQQIHMAMLRKRYLEKHFYNVKHVWKDNISHVIICSSLFPCAKLLHYQTQSVSCNKGPEITVIMIFQEQYQHSDIRVAIRQEMLTSSQL